MATAASQSTLGVGELSTTILVADDHPVVRFGVISLLDAQPDLKVIGEADSCAKLLDRLAALVPDVVLLDLELGDACGSEALSMLRKRYPDLKIVVFTAHDDDAHVLDAVTAGVQGYVVKGSANETLSDAIRVVSRGGSFLDASITPKVISQLSRKTPEGDRLTNREHVVLTYLGTGRRNKDIAEKLEITERTVKYHISSILAKLGAQNRTQAVQIAATRGLIKIGG
jgi:DNA-binding NarL/FixJ family response regulator